MGKIIPFSKVDTYIKSLKVNDQSKGTILDTNILISASYEARDNHDDVNTILDFLQENNYQLFATVNTRSEYLEFQRRLILTENIFDLTDNWKIFKIPQRARAKIQTLKGSLKTSYNNTPEKDWVFNESQLKKIKKEFSAGPHSGQKGWLELCNLFLKNQITLADQDLIERGVSYISPNNQSHYDFFDNSLNWASAINICERTGTAFSDSMILNALKSSKFYFILTLDFDIGYAALSDPNMKDVIVPDALSKEYKNFHFPDDQLF